MQGPRALETLQKLTKVDLAAIKNYWFTWGEVARIAQCVDCAHRLLRRGRLRGLRPLGRGDHGKNVERADGGGRRSSAFAPAAWARATPCGWRPACRSTATRSPTRSMCGSRCFALAQDSTRASLLDARLWRPSQAAGGPKRKVVALEMVDRGIARDGYSVLSLEGSGDRHDYFRLARAVLEDQHRVCAGAGGRSGRRRRSPGAGARQSGAGQAGAHAVLQAGNKVARATNRGSGAGSTWRWL